MKLIFGLIFFALNVQAADRCFTMKPLENFNQNTCAPVSVIINLTNCTTGAEEKSFEAKARFECKKNPKKLKYWYEDSMLVGELTAVGGTYKVSRTYAEFHGAPKSKSSTSGVAILATGPAIPSLPVPTLPAATTVAEKPAPAASPEPSPSSGASLSALADKLAAATPVPAPPPAAVVEPEKSSLHLSKMKISGLIDGYYAYNFNQPQTIPQASPYGAAAASQNTYVIPVLYHDQMALNLAKLVVSQEAEPIGFHIDLGYGSFSDVVAGSGSDSSTRALMQAFASYKTPWGTIIDAGKFFTHMGFELIETNANLNYTQTLLTGYILPLWHTGVRMNHSFADLISATLMVANGNNITYENNHSKTFGAQIKATPGAGFELTANFLSGNETASPGPADVRTVYEGIASWSLLSELKLAIDYAQGAENLNGFSDHKMTSTAYYAAWKFVDDWTLSARHEIFNDGNMMGGPSAPNVLLNTTGQVITGTTATLEYRLSQNLRLRGEYRMDSSDQNAYLDKEAQPAKTQSIALVAATLGF